MDEQKGLAVGRTYRNANQAPVSMHSIAEVERKKVEEEISASKFISIMADGSTDSSVMEDVMKTNNRCRKVEDLLTGLFTFYHRSPLNRATLKKSFSVQGMKPLMPTRVGGTRWVSHLMRALDHFLKGYKGIVHHLEQV